MMPGGLLRPMGPSWTGLLSCWALGPDPGNMDYTLAVIRCAWTTGRTVGSELFRLRGWTASEMSG
jgi:hypothetical protein